MKTTLLSNATLFLGLAAVGLFSCKKSEETPVAPVGNARVQIIHAAVNSPSLDVYQNTNRIVTPFEYGRGNGYQTYKAEAQTFDINEVGKSNRLYTVPAFTPVTNADYTIILVNRSTTDQALDAINLRDTLTTSSSGKAFVRFVHAIPNAGNIGITKDTISIIPGIPAAGITYRAVTRFAEVVAGNSNYSVVDGNTKVIANLSSNFDLTAGRYYTIIAMGTISGTGAQEPKLVKFENVK